MILMAAEGLSNDQIALRLDTGRDVVSLWRKRFFMERLGGLEEVAPGVFPPKLVVQVKAWACELPSTHDLPLSRWSTTDLGERFVSRAWSLPSAAVRFGGGCIKMPFDPGTTVAGSSQAIPTAPTKLAESSTCMPAHGKEML